MTQMSFWEMSAPKLKIDKPLRLIELFAGIGAQAKALENLGVSFEHYRICEFDKYAVKSYNAVHGTSWETSDITKIHAADLGIVDTDKYCYLMTYSFPCTDLSKAGAQKGMGKGSGTRSGLLWEVERLLKEMDELPQILLMENVPDVISEKFMPDFREWIAFLESIGYTSAYKVLNATGFDIPQNRDRCYMVSWLGNAWYEFPEPHELNASLNDFLDDKVDEKYYLNDEQVIALKESSFNASKQIADLTERERERDGGRNADGARLQGREICKTLRCGGRASLDAKHIFDVVRVWESE